MLEQNPEAARDRDTVNVVVAECFDGWLSDARALHVRPEHALEAISGREPTRRAQGAVGAGTGTTASASRPASEPRRAGSEPSRMLGCLVGVELRRPPRPATCCSGRADAPPTAATRRPARAARS